jgi:hypothetical protein
MYILHTHTTHAQAMNAPATEQEGLVGENAIVSDNSEGSVDAEDESEERERAGQQPATMTAQHESENAVQVQGQGEEDPAEYEAAG